MHPSESIRGMKSGRLKDKKIVLGITGSIAAVECLELARELIRHGADVHAVLSPDGAKLITPWAMEFATGHPAIVELDGKVQHVDLLGDFPDRADLLLIAPCTANTVSKVATGIDDTPVTTMATIALGTGVPVLIAPAMHASMFQNPFVKENIERLGSVGVRFIGPRMEGKKAKIADNEEIVANVIRTLSGRPYQGRKVLIIGGSSEEPIDDMRVVTNRGTGETAVELAKAAFGQGAEVELWMGRCSVPLPSYIPTRRFLTVRDLVAMIPMVHHDLVFVPAALSDFAPVARKGKISSDNEGLVLDLEPVPKVLPLLADRTKVVGFKAESGVREDELVTSAMRRLEQHGVEMIVANDLRNVMKGSTEVILVERRSNPIKLKGSKAEVAWSILSEARDLL
jgi:phosphopantothenoylcysteine decarboxylase/phosphopantothenate--cysteine ligase